MGKIKTSIVNIHMPLNMSADELAIELSEQQYAARQQGLMIDIRVTGEPSKKTEPEPIELDADILAALVGWQRYVYEQGVQADAYNLAVAAKVEPEPVELELDEPIAASAKPSLDRHVVVTNGDVAREIAAGYENITLRDYFELDEHIQNDIRTAWRFSSTLKQLEKLADEGIVAKDSELATRLEALAWERYGDN